jgi:DNA-binding transcriptional regulator YdaS (Cro superfamily)
MRRPGMLSSFDAVVDVLGGATEVAKLLGAQQPAVSNWRVRGGKFPAHYYLDITEALSRKQLTCRTDLFTFRRPNRRSNGKRKTP